MPCGRAGESGTRGLCGAPRGDDPTGIMRARRKSETQPDRTVAGLCLRLNAAGADRDRISTKWRVNLVYLGSMPLLAGYCPRISGVRMRLPKSPASRNQEELYVHPHLYFDASWSHRPTSFLSQT